MTRTLTRTFSISKALKDKISEKKEEIAEAEAEAAKDEATDPEVAAMLAREKDKLAAEEAEEAERKKSEVLIEETEKITGTEQKMEFQSDTKKLLDIVTRSLYSEREVQKNSKSQPLKIKETTSFA